MDDGAADRDREDVRFVAVARLELDELLEQLVERIRDVQSTQGRLRGLLRANLDIAQGVDLEHVLRQIVSAARQLVDARYAALGVVQDGHLVRFVHEGMGTHGVLTLARRRGAGQFVTADLEQFTAFAAHAGLVLDVAALRRESDQIRMLEDRQRIATDLQETLIRDLFALGLSLQGAASRIGNPEARSAVTDSVEQLDRIIRGVRTVVFAMEPRT